MVYNEGDLSSRESLSMMFPSDDSSERFGFTLLHKVVVGLNKLDLSTLLESLSRSDINACDVKGRTAAWWAARRGNNSALSLLIKHGADVNTSDDRRALPLDAAIDSNSSDCIWMLLRSGVDKSCTTKGRSAHNRWTSLHRSCYIGSELSIVEWLIEQGWDIEAQARYDLTPLHLTLQEGNDSLVECLLSKGANANARAITGDTPLHLAIMNNRNKVIRPLLRNRADCSLQTAAGETILHHAAQFANSDTLQTLRLFDLSRVSLSQRVKATSPTQKIANIKGLTALEIAERRKGVSSEWLATFRQLVHEIEHPESGVSVGGQPEEDDFEDALEHQDQ